MKKIKLNKTEQKVMQYIAENGSVRIVSDYYAGGGMREVNAIVSLNKKGLVTIICDQIGSFAELSKEVQS